MEFNRTAPTKSRIQVRKEEREERMVVRRGKSRCLVSLLMFPSEGVRCKVTFHLDTSQPFFSAPLEVMLSCDRQVIAELFSSGNISESDRRRIGQHESSVTQTSQMKHTSHLHTRRIRDTHSLVEIKYISLYMNDQYIKCFNSIFQNMQVNILQYIE